MRSLLAALPLLFAFAPSVFASQSPAAEGAFARAHRQVSTQIPAAQEAFDEGLTLLDAFNPESARASFELAAKEDPALAMAWWGVAMSHGININTGFDEGDQRAGSVAIRRAQTLLTNATPAERALVAAAAIRFSYTRSADADRSAQAFREAMDRAALAFPQDDDIVTLAAEAAMDARPWSYYNADGSPKPETATIVERLTTVLARSPQHIEANHLLIHVLEDARQPERALPAARALAAMNFEPAAEHLAHMPAHTFMRVGDYHAAGMANARAVSLYRTFLASDPPGHTDYFEHDCVSGLDAFMMSGEFAAARRMATACDRDGYALAAEADLRFGRYDDLERLTGRDDFAVGMAAAHAARADDAARHLAQLRKLGGGGVASIEADVLAARLLAIKGDFNGEVSSLQHAIATQDGLGYAEPPPFWLPVRETLGGAYFGAGRYADAERTFRAELDHDAENPRALFGLADTRDREGRPG